MTRYRFRDYQGREESLRAAAFGAGLALAGAVVTVAALVVWLR